MPKITNQLTATGAALERRLKRLGLTGDEDDWTDRYLHHESGRFSSDRTIAEYAAGIWNARPCPVP